MASSNEIKSDRILLKEVFEKWFRIPEYQRPYVWEYEEVHDLLDEAKEILALAWRKPMRTPLTFTPSSGILNGRLRFILILKLI